MQTLLYLLGLLMIVLIIKQYRPAHSLMKLKPGCAPVQHHHHISRKLRNQRVEL